MAERLKILAELRRILKAKGQTYGNLAAHMSISEATVKRMLSGAGPFTLERLEQTCAFLDVHLSDLIVNAAEHSEDRSLTLEQEVALAADTELFVVFYTFLLGYKFEDVERGIRVPKERLDRCVIELDKLKLIELHPGNRVRTSFTYHLRWLEGGPLMSRFGEEMKQDFLLSKFSQDNEKFRFEGAHLTSESLVIVGRKIDGLIEEIRELSLLDIRHARDRTISVSFLAAFRTWVPRFVREYLNQ